MHPSALLFPLALCATLLSSSIIPGATIPSALAHPQEYIQASFDGIGTFADGDPQFFDADGQAGGSGAAVDITDESAAQGNSQRNGNSSNNNRATATQGRNGASPTGFPGKKGKSGKQGGGKKGKQPDCTPTRSSGKKGGGGMRPTQPSTTGVFDGDRGKKAAKTVTAIPSPTAGAGKKKSGEARGNEAESSRQSETPAAQPKVEEQSSPAPTQPADAGKQQQAAKSSALGDKALDRRVVLAAMVGGMAVLA